MTAEPSGPDHTSSKTVSDSVTPTCDATLDGGNGDDPQTGGSAPARSPISTYSDEFDDTYGEDGFSDEDNDSSNTSHESGEEQANVEVNKEPTDDDQDTNAALAPKERSAAAEWARKRAAREEAGNTASEATEPVHVTGGSPDHQDELQLADEKREEKVQHFTEQLNVAVDAFMANPTDLDAFRKCVDDISKANAELNDGELQALLLQSQELIEAAAESDHASAQHEQSRENSAGNNDGDDDDNDGDDDDDDDDYSDYDVSFDASDDE